MIKNIKDLGFNKHMEQYIENVEECFNEITKTQNNKNTMLNWVNNKLTKVELDGMLENLNDRERFLFAFAMLSNEIEQWLK